MRRISDLEIGDEVQIETGYTNWNRADNEFYCTVAGYDEEGIPWSMTITGGIASEL